MKKAKNFMLQIIAAALLICITVGLAACNISTAMITLENHWLNMLVGEEKTLAVTVEGTDGERTWTSSDETVITVDKDGKVKALKSGEARVTVKLGTTEDSCKITVADNTTVTEAEWKAAMNSANYTIADGQKESETRNVVKLTNITEDGGTISYTAAGETEKIYTIAGENIYKYENGAWAAIGVDDLTSIAVATEIIGSFPLSALADLYSKFSKNDLLDYYTTVNAEEVEVPTDDGSVKIDYVKFYFVNGKLVSGQFYNKTDICDRYISAVGTTVIDVPALDPGSIPSTPDTPSDPLAIALSQPVTNVTIEIGMVKDSQVVPAMKVKFSGEWLEFSGTSYQVSEDHTTTAIPFCYFFKATDSGVVYWISEDGATISGEGKSVNDSDADSEAAGFYMMGMLLTRGHEIFANYTSQFTYDEATGAYTAASVTAPSIDWITQEQTTQEFKNVKIVVADGQLFSLEYTIEQAEENVLFKYSDYGTTVVAPTVTPAE